MATSESDDFESADEELNARTNQSNRRTKKYASIGSDSDDDVDFIPVQTHNQTRGSNKTPSRPKRSHIKKIDDSPGEIKMDIKKTEDTKTNDNVQSAKNIIQDDEKDDGKTRSNVKDTSETVENHKLKVEKSSEKTETNADTTKNFHSNRERPQRQRKQKEALSLGAKKLGATKIEKFPDVESTPDEVRNKASLDGKATPLIQECWEEFDEKNLLHELENTKSEGKNLKGKTNEDSENIPEELKSNLKFKDIFKPDGWEGLGNDVELPDDLSDDKYQPVLDKLTTSQKEEANTNGSWGGWGTWGVTSLLNTASVGVSTLTSHVTQGLSLLEESIGVPDPADLIEKESPESEEKEEQPESEEQEVIDQDASPLQYLPSSFGFSNLMSSVSSITKYVESTSTKVISGGLDTLETIGKKTMEVLQEGDPGLKKKRAFFSNDADKPNLSSILREAKDKADVEEKSIEEKELARKVHFESLFDDYQGLVHLEALEMLSKQCNMKIQQQLINLDGSELTSMQETLDEVKELCDLGDEDNEEDEEKNKDLEKKLQEACKDLGISVTYDKLIDVWDNMNLQIPPPDSTETSIREIFQKAISSLAQFTAYSVERFHKSAELLLIKERRSTVNEADSLVQLTKTLSSQIGYIADLYCNRLKEFKEETEKSDVNSSITTIFLEATNASSYVQEAFRLLIPILQVGAI